MAEYTSASPLNLLDFILASSEEEYTGTIEELRTQCLVPDFGRKEMRAVDCGFGPEKMSAGRLLVNLVALFPYRAAASEFAPGRVIRSQLDASSIERHMDETISELYSKTDPLDLSRSAASSSNYLMDLASGVTGRVGTSISIKSIFEAGNADPRIKELLSWKTPHGDLETIERAADDAGKEISDRLAALPGEFGRLIQCGAAVNRDQLRQTIVSIGVKPGLMDGEIIPEPIDTSFLRGMRSVQDMYICAIGARKALITNFRQVKTSGYLARKLVLLVSKHSIDPDLVDCGTMHGIHTPILSADHVSRLDGRFMCDAGGRDFEMYSREELMESIGSEVILRSPVTCGGTAGVCHTCYGSLARSNVSIHAGVYGTLVISEQITQRLLGSKHLLKARPTTIEWPPEFLLHFAVERAAIIPESLVERIWVQITDIDEGEDDDAAVRTTQTFYYRVSGRQARLKVTLPVPITLEEGVWEDVEEDDGELSLIATPENPVFLVPVTNTDLSEALRDIFALIEHEDLSGPDEAYKRLLLLLEKSAIRTPSIHAEMILRALARDPENLMHRPDYSGPEEPKIVMLKLRSAILMSSSVTNSLAFEAVKAQLMSAKILQKDESGVLDVMFGG
jgi:hypothetical protein